MTLDRADLTAAKILVGWYMDFHRHHRRPVDPIAVRLSDNLDTALAANGQKKVAPEDHWITTGEAARRLHKSERTARRIAEQGIGRRVGRQWLLPADAIPEEE